MTVCSTVVGPDDPDMIRNVTAVVNFNPRYAPTELTVTPDGTVTPCATVVPDANKPSEEDVCVDFTEQVSTDTAEAVVGRATTTNEKSMRTTRATDQ